MYKEEEIIICSNCKGGGKLLERHSIDEYIGDPCKRCNGSGRLIKYTSIEWKPFK